MAAPLVPSLLKDLVYPATLTMVGLAGNAYILGGQIQDIKKDLGGQIQDIKKDTTTTKEDMIVMKENIKSLLRRQTELEAHDMA